MDNQYTFLFDPNFSVFDDGVFSAIDPNSGGSSPPPPNQDFLLLNGQDFLLLNGDNLSLL